jgi:hypothetical protein
MGISKPLLEMEYRRSFFRVTKTRDELRGQILKTALADERLIARKAWKKASKPRPSRQVHPDG